MTATLQAKDVIERFAQVIPGAASYAKSYLRTIEQSVENQQLPVRVTREEIDSNYLGFARGSAREGLVIQPDASTFSGFAFFHYGFPIGVNLAVGWYVTERGRGLKTLAYAAHVVTGGLAGMSDAMGAMNLFDQATLIAIFESVHRFAVMEAIHAIAEKVEFDSSRIAGRSTGMFGIG